MSRCRPRRAHPQTPTKLYLVMDYCNGGELFYHLKQAGRFPEPQARLYAGEICSALHHLHMLNAWCAAFSRKSLIHRGLEGHGLVITEAAIGGDHRLHLAIDQPIPQGIG